MRINIIEFKSVYLVVALVYTSCRVRNDFCPKKSIIRRLSSLFLVLAAFNNMNLNIVMITCHSLPFLLHLRTYISKINKSKEVKLRP